MQYFGGKARIAKRLADYVNHLIGDKDYYEPFCGSCNVTQHIVAKRRFASDAHKELIALHKHVQAGGWLPELVTEDDYRRARVTNDFEDWYRGFVGFGCSYSGKWFGGYARNKRGDNFAKQSANSLRKKHNTLKGVVFDRSAYDEVTVRRESVIYCDIPYKGTTEYSVEFDHRAFYEWARNLSADGSSVLVSEYACNVPSDFEVLLEIRSEKEIRNASGERLPTTEVLMTPKKGE